MQIRRDEIRPLPAMKGIRKDGERIHFDPAEYEIFIQRVTGIDIDTNISPTTANRIASQLEGFIDQKKTEEDWSPDLLEIYPTINSLTEIYALIRILRTYYASESKTDN